MTKPKVPHTIGCFYTYWIQQPAVRSVWHHRGPPSHNMPAAKTRRTGQLVDKRNNGILIMQTDYRTWDYPAGWAGPGAVAHMMGDTKKPITKTRLERIRSHQIIGLADSQPANRVPHMPKDAA